VFVNVKRIQKDDCYRWTINNAQPLTNYNTVLIVIVSLTMTRSHKVYCLDS
jgi:hypothetical protein